MAMLVCCPTTLVQTEICQIDCCQYLYEETTLGTCVLIFVFQYKKHLLSIMFRRNTFLFSAFSWNSSKLLFVSRLKSHFFDSLKGMSVR